MPATARGGARSPPAPSHAAVVRPSLPALPGHVHVIDDADDRGVHRGQFAAERLAGRTSFDHHEHALGRRRRRPNPPPAASRPPARRRGSRAARAAAWRPRTADACGCSPPARRRGRESSLAQCPVVQDADDAGVGGRLRRVERERRFLAAHEEHVLADAGSDAVHGHQRPADRLAVGAPGAAPAAAGCRRAPGPCGRRRRRR